MNKADLHKVDKIHAQLKKAIDKMPDHPFLETIGIPIDHALKNVRVNGVGRKVSYPDIKDDFNDLLKKCVIVIKELPNVMQYVNELEELLNTYVICPTCKGKQVTIEEQNNPNYHKYSYDDCEKCEGHGVIKK